MMETRLLLRLENVSKRFGALAAVDNVSVEIRENEFFALLGPSGCGKTTLLRMLAGFERPSGGKILLDGADVSAIPPHRRPVNMMFQSYALFPHMTVRANIAYGLEMERLPRPEIAERVEKMLAVTELSGLGERKPEQLSGGQRQRVALARALVKKPRLLLLDEPLAALDKKLRAAMQIELKRLQHEVGITFIVVTHDQEEALVMADRIAVLDHGKLLQCDAPAAVYERPSSRFVAGFIGLMNFIPGKAEGGGLAAAGARILAQQAARPLAEGAAAVAAVRPERITLLQGSAADNRCEGTIVATAYHGLDLQLHVRSPLSPEPILVRLTADAAERFRPSIGDAVTLGWSRNDTALFPA